MKVNRGGNRTDQRQIKKRKKRRKFQRDKLANVGEDRLRKSQKTLGEKMGGDALILGEGFRRDIHEEIILVG